MFSHRLVLKHLRCSAVALLWTGFMSAWLLATLYIFQGRLSLWVMIVAGPTLLAVGAWLVQGMDFDSGRRILLAFLGLNVVNWLAWYGADIGMDHLVEGLAERSDVSIAAIHLSDLARTPMTFAFAMMITLGTSVAAWTRHTQLMNSIGVWGVVMWLSISCMGFVVSSAHLIVLD